MLCYRADTSQNQWCQCSALCFPPASVPARPWQAPEASLFAYVLRTGIWENTCLSGAAGFTWSKSIIWHPHPFFLSYSYNTTFLLFRQRCYDIFRHSSGSARHVKTCEKTVPEFSGTVFWGFSVCIGPTPRAVTGRSRTRCSC